MKPITLYFPPTPSEYPAWADNFYRKLDAYKALLNIAPADLDQIERLNLGLGYYGRCISSYDQFVKQCISNRNIMIYGDANNPEFELTEYIVPPAAPVVPLEQVPPNEHTWVMAFVARLRKNPHITAAISKELGIDYRPASTYDEGVPPILRAKVVNGQAQLNCPLKNFKGYEVWRRDTPAGAFAKVGTSISRYYIDMEELPEGVHTAQRTYIVRMVTLDNVPMGLPSNEMLVVVFRAVVPS